MDNSAYKSLALRSAICPGMETKWPPAETSHGIALHKCGNELRALVDKTQAAIEAVNADKSLSPEGKRERKCAIGRKALDEMAVGTHLATARERVRAQMDRWAQKIAASVKPPESQAEVQVHAEIRQKVAEMKDASSRLTFLKQHGTEPVTAAALLSVPGYLANLSEPELALLRTEVEKRYLTPEIVEAKRKTAEALAEAERSYRAAQSMIKQSSGVDKPTAAELAMARPQQVVA